MTTATLQGTGRAGIANINWPRGIVAVLTCTAIFLPLFLIFYQSFLSAPFFMPGKEVGLDAFRFIFDDPDFAVAFKNGLLLAALITSQMSMSIRWARSFSSFTSAILTDR